MDLIADVTKLLAAIEALDDISEESRDDLKALLEELTFESVRVMKTSPTQNNARREVLFQRALEAIAKQRLPQAEEILKAAIESFPNDVELLNHLGLVAWEKGDMDEAAEIYGTAMKAGFPEEGMVDWFDDSHRPFLRAMEGHALALYQNDKMNEALPLFEALADMNPVDYAGCRYLAGEIRHLTGDIDGAVSDYERVTGEPAVLYNLALGYFQLGNIEKTIATLLRAFASNPFIAQRLLHRRSDSEQTIPGYLASDDYAEEFVSACTELWDETSVEFMRCCFDHPLVRAHIAACRDRIAECPGALAEESWHDAFGGSGTIGNLVDRVKQAL